MTQKFMFVPKDTEIIAIQELENDGYEVNINTDISLRINTNSDNNVQIYEPLECTYIQVSHQDFRKMIDIYNEITKRINNEKKNEKI